MEADGMVNAPGPAIVLMGFRERGEALSVWTMTPLYRLGEADLRSATNLGPVTDGDGVPYCEGAALASWARYVATDEDGGVYQYETEPSVIDGTLRLNGEWGPDIYGQHDKAPAEFRHPGNWKESLMRVWRPGEQRPVHSALQLKGERDYPPITLGMMLRT